MNTKTNLLITVIFFFYSYPSVAQTSYSGRFELGNLKSLGTIVDVDPSVGWRGHYLDENAKGLRVDWVNGISFNRKLFTGIGLGYLNFEGINGFCLYSDLEYVPLKYKFSPLINFKLGYSHIWNQYDGGTKTSLIELNLGLHHKLNNRHSISLKSGITLTQQSLLIPITLGFRY
ncbi:MAG: hypothetical protein H6584_02850 [Flavobacteriales bacterium]|nr:hypothetical protein [Flavobacteriales bacterium]